MDPDRIEAALDGLGAESRALVELSVVRDLADDDIAGLLGTDEAAVRGRRDEALARLARELGATSDEEVGRLLREARNGTSRASAASPPAQRPRRLLPALIGGLLLAAAIALVLAVSGGGDDEKQAAEPAGRARLNAIAGGGGKGTAELTDGNIELSVSGLPDSGDDGYVTWLYNSLAEARPLNRPQKGSAFELRAKLPEGADRYRFVDVSLEADDENRNHSGQSVLRVPLSDLR